METDDKGGKTWKDRWIPGKTDRWKDELTEVDRNMYRWMQRQTDIKKGGRKRWMQRHKDNAKINGWKDRMIEREMYGHKHSWIDECIQRFINGETI